MAKAQTQTQDRQTTAQAPRDNGAANMTRPNDNNQVAVFYEPRLPYHPAIGERFGVDKSGWKVLCEARFPTASSPDSVILALAYCKARNLDVFKAVIHIVPIWNKQLGRLVDTIWPGIGELRTTAHRTKDYAGHEECVMGPMIEAQVGNVKMRYPEYAQMTVYRFVHGARCAFPGPKVYWIETYATFKRDDDSPNDMWRNRPIGQIVKCAEAASLRGAFPEELGSDYIPEEIERGATYGVVPQKTIAEVSQTQSTANRLIERLKEPPQETTVEEVHREPVQHDREPGDDSEPKITAANIRDRLNVCSDLAGIAAIEELVQKFEPADARDPLWQDVSRRKAEIEKLNPKQPGQLPLS